MERLNKNSKVLILGSTGLVGSAFCRNLKLLGYKSILSPPHAELDLLNTADVYSYFRKEKPNIVINAAARVGGIKSNNTLRADFIYENLQIQMNVIKASFDLDVETLLNFGSNCAYPRESSQPIKEDYLLTGPLEPTNEPYAVAKIAGIKLCESYRRQYNRNFLSIIPTSLYGVNDTFDSEKSHVIPGLISRMNLAILSGDKTFQVWGSGTPRREFMYVDDLVEACLLLLNTDKELPYWINIGPGIDYSIKELVQLVADEMNFSGEITFDLTKPDGMPRKLLESSFIKSMGWKPKIDLTSGLRKTIEFYKKEYLK